MPKSYSLFGLNCVPQPDEEEGEGMSRLYYNTFKKRIIKDEAKASSLTAWNLHLFYRRLEIYFFRNTSITTAMLL